MGYRRRQERIKRHERGDFDDTPKHVARTRAMYEKFFEIPKPKPRWVKPEHPIAFRRRMREMQRQKAMGIN